MARGRLSSSDARRGPTKVVGRYALFDRIATGGMATVHLGRLVGAAGFARTVAIKRLRPNYARDPKFVRMFIDEARLSSRIRHPNVAATIDVVSDGARARGGARRGLGERGDAAHALLLGPGARGAGPRGEAGDHRVHGARRVDRRRSAEHVELGSAEDEDPLARMSDVLANLKTIKLAPRTAPARPEEALDDSPTVESTPPTEMLPTAPQIERALLTPPEPRATGAPPMPRIEAPAIADRLAHPSTGEPAQSLPQPSARSPWLVVTLIFLVAAAALLVVLVLTELGR